MTRNELKERVTSFIVDHDGQQVLIDQVLEVIDEFCNELARDVRDLDEILKQPRDE